VDLPTEIRIRCDGLRPVVRTTAEALRLIDLELSAEVRGRRRWAFARALLVEAEQSNKKRDATLALRQLKQALSNEGWLHE
jgi:hypothetical protein